MIVKCVTAGTTARGQPGLHLCKVQCDGDQYAEGEHYVAAREQAEGDGHEGEMVVFDEKDGPDFLFHYFDWDTVITVRI